MSLKYLLLSLIVTVALHTACNKGNAENNNGSADTAGSSNNIPPGNTGENVVDGDTPFKNMIGINGFDWSYTQDNSADFDNEKFTLIQTFTAFRQYLDWDRVEEKEGRYQYSYDDIYEKNKQNNITTLLCLQITPKWFRKKYYPGEYDPADEYNSLRDYTPVPKGADKSDPASYIAMAKAGFQIAARYGTNANIDKSLVKAVTWGDRDDTKIGLGTLQYIECSNEPDKDWKGPNAQQTPEQYAAQLSAFYDGHMGTLGKGVGVKNADPNIKVVMAGLAFPRPGFVREMITWCKKNRVKDGKYTLCFDVINFHEYSSSRKGEYWSNPDLAANHGMAPELSDVGANAAEFVKLSAAEANNTEVWVTECGFDVNEKSIQRALPIGKKTITDTQADWTLRTALLYARKGIKRVFFYMLNDVNKQSDVQYNSSGLLEDNKRRPSADFLFQAKNLIGEYKYNKTLHDNPIVDLYTLNNKKFYVLTVPDQKGREETYELDLGADVKEAIIYRPQADSDSMRSEKKPTAAGKISIQVTETPTFIEAATITN